MILYGTRVWNQVGVATLISEVVIKPKLIRNDKGHYIWYKLVVQWENNCKFIGTGCYHNQFMKQKFLDKKGDIDTNIVIPGDFTTPSHK